MQTTIVMQDNHIMMFHSGGASEEFVGVDGVKRFMKRFQKVTKAMETSQAITDAMFKAEAGRGLSKLKKSLKDKRLHK